MTTDTAPQIDTSNLAQIKDVAPDIGVTRQWVHKMINTGELNTYFVSGHRFVVKDSKYAGLKEKRRLFNENRVKRHEAAAAKALLPKRGRGRPRKEASPPPV